MYDTDILLIRMGGTIDAEPYDEDHTLRKPPRHVTTLKGERSSVRRWVRGLYPDMVEVYDWLRQGGAEAEDRFVKDSKDLTREDILALADIIKSDSHKYFIVTHGTDAMVKNARALKEALADTDKVVAFVGAMVPLSMHQTHLPSWRHWRQQIASDGVEALDYVCKTINEPSDGVYVVGRDNKKSLEFFDPDDVEKNWRKSRKLLSLTFRHVNEHEKISGANYIPR